MVLHFNIPSCKTIACLPFCAPSSSWIYFHLLIFASQSFGRGRLSFDRFYSEWKIFRSMWIYIYIYQQSRFLLLFSLRNFQRYLLIFYTSSIRSLIQFLLFYIRNKIFRLQRVSCRKIELCTFERENLLFLFN